MMLSTSSFSPSFLAVPAAAASSSSSDTKTQQQYNKASRRGQQGRAARVEASVQVAAVTDSSSSSRGQSNRGGRGGRRGGRGGKGGADDKQAAPSRAASSSNGSSADDSQTYLKDESPSSRAVARTTPDHFVTQTRGPCAECCMRHATSTCSRIPGSAQHNVYAERHLGKGPNPKADQADLDAVKSKYGVVGLPPGRDSGDPLRVAPKPRGAAFAERTRPQRSTQP